MYREIAGTDERVRAIPGVRNRRVRPTKVRLYFQYNNIIFHSTLYLCIMSILLHNMYGLVSYATCEWPEMYSFQYSYLLFRSENFWPF